MNTPPMDKTARFGVAYGIAARELFGEQPSEPERIMEAVRRMIDDDLLTMSDEALMCRLCRAIRANLKPDRSLSV